MNCTLPRGRYAISSRIVRRGIIVRNSPSENYNEKYLFRLSPLLSRYDTRYNFQLVTFAKANTNKKSYCDARTLRTEQELSRKSRSMNEIDLLYMSILSFLDGEVLSIPTSWNLDPPVVTASRTSACYGTHPKKMAQKRAHPPSLRRNWSFSQGGRNDGIIWSTGKQYPCQKNGKGGVQNDYHLLKTPTLELCPIIHIGCRWMRP